MAWNEPHVESGNECNFGSCLSVDVTECVEVDSLNLSSIIKMVNECPLSLNETTIKFGVALYVAFTLNSIAIVNNLTQFLCSMIGNTVCL